MGTGRVGELTVQYSVSQIADGQFTATASVPSLLWSATDGNLTLHWDGTLEVQYPSNGIVEYWRRADGAPTRHRQQQARSSALPSRPIKLVIRHFGPGSPLGSSTDLGWHWGLAIGDEDACYEVAGSMAVIGPNGILAASSPLATNIKPTHLWQYDAFLELPQTTQRTNAEVKGFLSPVGAQSSHLQCPRTQLPDVCRGPLQLPLRREPAVLQVGVPHRQVRPWTRAPPIDPVDQAREAALLTLLPHRLRVGTYRLTVWDSYGRGVS